MEADSRPRLFSTEPRTDGSPGRHNEGVYAFMDRVDRQWFDSVRQLLERWLDGAPARFAQRIARNIRATGDRQFYAAFWELYQFTLWTHLGHTVELEPPVGDSGRLADFLVTRTGQSATIEATVSFDEATDSAASRRLADAYDSLDGTDSPNFFLWIEVEQGEGATPSMAPIRRELEAWLATLDPGDVAASIDTGPRRRDLPTLTLHAATWQLRFEAIPKSAEARGEPGIRPLGAFGTGGARTLTTVARVRNALAAKADQTRNAEGPVIIALDALGFFVDSDDIYSSLFGDEAIQFRTGPAGEMDTARVRQMTGLWTEGRLGRRAHVSAVLVAENLGPWNLARVDPVLWVNPWANRPIQLDLPFERIEIDLTEGKRTDYAARDQVWRILGLAPDWPGPGNPWDDV